MSATPENISGLLNINKPAGITSHDVVNRVRKLTGQRKVGHAGTLDPMATGVLLLCLGQATRLIEYLMADSKQYRATVCFGVSTNTLDADGEVTATKDISPLTENQLRELLPGFIGEVEQIPPAFSAIKKDGQPLYKRARTGQPVDLEPRRVRIDSLTWVDWQPPHLVLDVTCSAGTYIRSLARDLGNAAGTGAHLSQLTRTASGKWTLDKSIALDQLEGKLNWQQHLLPADQAVSHLPRVTLSDEAVRHVRHGRQIEIDPLPISEPLRRAYTPGGDFLAILTRVESDDKLWQPKKVFHTGSQSVM